MIYQPFSPLEPSAIADFLDFHDSNFTQTALSPAQVQQAAHLSEAIGWPEQRWQVYRSALGVLGFGQWLQDCAPELNVEAALGSISLSQPAAAHWISAACNVRVGDFRLCLLAVGSMPDETVNIPAAALVLPEWSAHFYVLVEVLEEQDQVAVTGFLTYDTYRQQQARQPLPMTADGSYELPLSWFQADPEALLLQLRCLDSAAIALPTAPTLPLPDPAAVRQTLMALQDPFLQPLGHLLSGTEILTLLHTPALLSWAYERAIAPQSSAQPAARPAAAIPSLINVAHWLERQLDEVAATLGWVLLPSPGLAAWRSLRSEFAPIRTALAEQGLDIPTGASGAYRELRWSDGSARLYALTWLLTAQAETAEWTLLIVLERSPHPRSSRLTLTVRDETQPLFEQALDAQGAIYTQVIGEVGERFWVTVAASDNTVFEMPPFGFEINAELGPE